MFLPRFIIAGALNTGLTYLAYLALLFIFPYTWAYSLSYAFGILLGYLLNSIWVFKKQPSLNTAATYPIIYAINYMLGLSLLSILISWLQVPKEIAPLIVMCISIPTMYYLSRLIFQEKI